MFQHLKPNTEVTFEKPQMPQEAEPVQDIARCEICGEPMPEGEEMFKFHGYSGGCPKPPLKADQAELPEADRAERPDDPAAIEPKAPLIEAEAILAWLKTQPSTPENKALRAQAGIVVDYLKAK